MLSVLSNPTYRHLILAQVIALLGTGLATIALGLLAYDLAGAEAAMVLATALTIKMVTYVTVAPLAAALAERLNRKRMLIFLDIVRASVALVLPFVSEIWQIYGLIFVLQAASASFTPLFQATIPDVLSEEEDYTKALSLSRLAYDLENLISPVLAAALLTVMSFGFLFWGTALGFMVSAGLILAVTLPASRPVARRGAFDRITRGTRLYLKTPRLRGVLALNWAVSAVGAMVLVNTVVIVQSDLGLPQQAVAWAFAAFGGGSMVAALALPRLLQDRADRNVMISGAVFAIAAMAGLWALLQVVPLSMTLLLVGWACVGLGYSATLTPTGRVMTRSAHKEDRPAIFAAHFTLSHMCWLVFYPLSGWLMTQTGAQVAMLGLSMLGALGIVVALRVWPAGSSAPIEHAHPDLPSDHPHLQGDGPHMHPIIIDDLHPSFPYKR
jgi:MFS family permease